MFHSTRASLVTPYYSCITAIQRGMLLPSIRPKLPPDEHPLACLHGFLQSLTHVASQPHLRLLSSGLSLRGYWLNGNLAYVPIGRYDWRQATGRSDGMDTEIVPVLSSSHKDWPVAASSDFKLDQTTRM